MWKYNIEEINSLLSVYANNWCGANEERKAQQLLSPREYCAPRDLIDVTRDPILIR